MASEGFTRDAAEITGLPVSGIYPGAHRQNEKLMHADFKGFLFLQKKKKITPFPSGSEIPHRFLLSAAALLPVWLEGESKPSSLLCSGV